MESEKLQPILWKKISKSYCLSVNFFPVASSLTPTLFVALSGGVRVRVSEKGTALLVLWPWAMRNRLLQWRAETEREIESFLSRLRSRPLTRHPPNLRRPPRRLITLVERYYLVWLWFNWCFDSPIKLKVKHSVNFFLWISFYQSKQMDALYTTGLGLLILDQFNSESSIFLFASELGVAKLIDFGSVSFPSRNRIFRINFQHVLETT